MNIISEIDRHEALRRWAIGEVNSEYFCRSYGSDPALREQTLVLLKSGNPIKEAEGIRRHQCIRAPLICRIPWDTRWFLASLNVIEDEFQGLRTIRDNNKWNEYSSGTYMFCVAANYLIRNPGADQRISSIISGLPDGNVCLTGITLISDAKEGPYTIAEGTARLVAIYYHCIFKGTKLFANNAMEVSLGVSKTKWYWSPV